jgi:UDP-N-acetylmuramoyl-tripeptide--D-alanyl-D-alanine ligase
MDLLQWFREGKFSGVFIDSRKPLEGGLFICIRGDKFDGNSFALTAIDSGAKAALMERHYYEDNRDAFRGKPIAVVEDGEKALLSLAAKYRDWLNPKVVSVVGSGGKTNTKNMFAEICRLAFDTHATKGNLNNHIGLPLTLLNMPLSTEILVLEMGVSRPGAMKTLASVARPDIVMMTNIGTSHIENFHSESNILHEKMQANAYHRGDHILVVNGFDPLLSQLPEQPYRVICTKPEALEVLSMKQGVHHFRYRGLEIQLQVPGAFQVKNALLCVEAARALGIEDEKIVQGIENYRGEPQRFMVSYREGITIVDDVYNSSPDSIAGAVETLLMLSGKRHLAVLGDVLELGETAEEIHRRIGEIPQMKQLDKIFTIGDFASHIIEKHPNGEHFRDIRSLIKKLNETLQQGDVLLVKASRGMELERVLRGLEIADE